MSRRQAMPPRHQEWQIGIQGSMHQWPQTAHGAACLSGRGSLLLRLPGCGRRLVHERAGAASERRRDRGEL